MPIAHRLPRSRGTASSGRPRGLARPLIATVAATLTAAALGLAMVFSGIASASTPVTVGYRDFGYGGALASRATSDPEQSKLWYNDGAWWAGLFVSSGKGSGGSHFDIFKFNPVNHSWVDTTRQIDIRDLSHADYLWDGAHNKLYVASSKSICTAAIAPPSQPCNDSIRVYRYTYNSAASTLATKYTLDSGFPKVLAGGQYNGGNFTGGGSNAVTIAKDSVGGLWVAYTRDDPTTGAPPSPHFNSTVYLAASSDDGLTWSAQAKFAGASVGQLDQDNTASIVAFGGTNVGLYWTDKHATGASSAFFATHTDGDPFGTWSGAETVITGTNAAENQVNLKADSAGKVYAMIKTGVSDQEKLFDRSTSGTWTSHVVSKVADGNTRAQVVLDEDLGLAYVFSSSGSTTAGAIYVKSAPLSTLAFPTGKGAAFIQSATDHAIDDISLTKQVVTSTTNLVAEVSDRSTLWFLHGELNLAAADTTPPVGTVTINNGDAATTLAAVTLAVPATDAGLGVNLVRVVNTTGHVDGSGMLDGAGAASSSWTATLPWTVSGGDGTKTVWVQFQDGAGNWSAPVSDTIILDSTGPVGTVTINNGDAASGDSAVTLDVTATDAGVGVVSNVRIANDPATSGGLLSDASAVTSAYATSKPWNLAPGPDGARTVYVQWEDAVGNWSGVSNDTITLADVVKPVGHVAINGGSVGIHSLSVTLSFPLTSMDVTEVQISNSPTMAGATFRPFAASISWTLPGLLTNYSVKAVYVVFKDGAGNISDPIAPSYSASATARVDLTKPVMHSPITPRFYAPTNHVGSTVPLRLGWPVASDTVTGVGSYRVLASRDGHAYTVLGAPTVNALNTLVYPGHTYRFRVYAVDRAGNTSAAVYTPTMRVLAYQDSSRSIRYSSGWHASSSIVYYGGTARWATVHGASASLTFIGRSVAWTSLVATTRGSANVYVDGRFIATVNLNTATTSVRRIVFARTWSTAGTHTIRIVVLGTAGHPRVDVDDLLVLR